MKTFSFEGVFSKAAGFFSKNVVIVLLIGLLFFAVSFTFELFAGYSSLNAIAEMQNSSFSTAVPGQSAGNPEAVSNVNRSVGRTARFFNGAILMRVLPQFLSGVLLLCLISFFLPACRGGNLRLINILPRLVPFILYVLFMVMMITSVIGASFMVIRLSHLFSAFILLPAGMFVVGVLYILILIRLFFVPFLFLDGVSFLDTFKRSFALTKGNGFLIFALLFCIWLINFFGGLIVVGIIFTIPFSVLVFIYTYLDVTGKAVEEADGFIAFEDAGNFEEPGSDAATGEIENGLIKNKDAEGK